MMKKILGIILTIFLCFGDITVKAQENIQLSIAPCWYGEAYSVDVVYTVTDGEIGNVKSLLEGCFFDWNYIPQENLLIVAVASSSPLPDVVEIGAYMSVTVSQGTTITLSSLKINGKNVAINHKVGGTIVSSGDENDIITVSLLQNSEVKYTVSVTGNNVSYTISDVSFGEYILQVHKQGHVSDEYTVVVTDEDVIQNVQLYLFGDVNGDGSVTETDVNLAKRYFAGYGCEINRMTADVDIDGTFTRRDAMILARYLENWEGYTLPYSKDTVGR